VNGSITNQETERASTVQTQTNSDREHIDQLNAEAWADRFTDLKRCLRQSQETLELAEILEYPRGRAYALRNLGFCAYATSEYESALKLLAEGDALGRELDDDRLIRDCLNFTAAVYASLGDFQAAFGFAQRAYRLSQSLNDTAGQVFGLMNLGILYHDLGRYEEALQTQLEALEKSQITADQSQKVSVLNCLGTNYSGLKRYNEAERVLREALNLVDAFGLNERKIPILVNLGEALGHLERFAEALETLEHAQALLGDASHEGRIYCLLNKGVIHLARNDPQRALGALEDGLHEAVTLGSKALEFQLHERLAQTQKLLNNPTRALEHFEHYHRIEREVRDRESERRLRAFTAQHDLEQARSEAEIERLRNVELARVLEALEAKSRELEVLVTQDPLTHLSNRRHLETALRNEFERAKQTGRPLPVALIDVDDFKSINDRFSHQVGDTVLVTIAGLLRNHTRSGDTVARYGGEEFALVLPDSTPAQALEVCQQLCRTIEMHDWHSIHSELHVTISVGLASHVGLAHHEKLLSMADASMYHAKQAGKNRVSASAGPE
jgi:diguanylate cyclase (GGDEF)-like protein